MREHTLLTAEYFFEYLGRLVPTDLKLADGDFHAMREWARMAEQSGRPADSRNELIHAWWVARAYIDEFSTIVDGELVQPRCDDAVKNILFDAISGTTSESQATDNEVSENVDSQPSIAARSNLTDEEFNTARTAIERMKLSSRFGDRLDVSLVRDEALHRVNKAWKGEGSVSALARRIAFNLFLDEIRKSETEEKRLFGIYSEAVFMKPRPDALTRILDHGEWEDQTDYLVLWSSTTDLPFHKALALFWSESGVARGWPYKEEELAIPLSKCAALILPALAPSIQAALLAKMACSPVLDGAKGPMLVEEPSYAKCIWNDFSDSSNRTRKFSVSRQIDDWGDQAKSSAKNLLGQGIWKALWKYLVKDDRHSIVTKICYCLTQGAKPRVKVKDFLKIYEHHTVEQLAESLSKRLETKGVDDGWIQTQITGEERTSRLAIRHRTIGTYYRPLEAVSNPPNREENLRLEVERRIRRLHQHLAFEVLRDLKRKYL